MRAWPPSLPRTCLTVGLFVVALIPRDLAALRWGVDTRQLDKSPEGPPQRERPLA